MGQWKILLNLKSSVGNDVCDNSISAQSIWTKLITWFFPVASKTPISLVKLSKNKVTVSHTRKMVAWKLSLSRALNSVPVAFPVDKKDRLDSLISSSEVSH